MSELSIRAEAVEVLLGDVTLYGVETRETGAFLLSREQEPGQLTLVALPTEAGARRSANLFEVPAPALAILFEWAAEEELVIRAQVHSHKRGAFLSWTDREHGFSVEGFITCVIPSYASPPKDPADWGWWEFRNGDWQRRETPTVVVGLAKQIDFDEGGICGC